jgi:hypothetical protein
MIKSKRGAEKCCITCGNVQWIDNEEHNRDMKEEMVAVTITENENGLAQIFTNPITSSMKISTSTFELSMISSLKDN